MAADCADAGGTDVVQVGGKAAPKVSQAAKAAKADATSDESDRSDDMSLESVSPYCTILFPAQTAYNQ